MKIGCLQFAPQVGDVDHNLNRADAVLSKANPQDLDLLVVPEMAFSGYNFRSLQHIAPFLEPTGSGITALWARCKALKYNCIVSAGYPEIVETKPYWPRGPEFYNSTITVNADGETIANYRKSHLYWTDETWALESSSGFYGGSIDGLGRVAMGICMDLNPYQFRAPWSAWEFAHHVLHVKANLVILSCAWPTREDPKSFSRFPREPDMDSLSYWLSRLEPIIRAEAAGEIIVVIANRCGNEEEAVYAGTSAVLGINDGEVKVYGILGRGEKELLVVDTSKPCQAKLISTPNVGSGISVASQSAGCDSSPFHGPSSKSPEDLRNALPFKYPSEAFSPVPETPFMDITSADELKTPEAGKSRHSLRMASDLNKSIFSKQLEGLTENLKPIDPELSPHFNSQVSEISSEQKECIPIAINLGSITATANATSYENLKQISTPVARIPQDYFAPKPNVPPADTARDFLQSTTGKSGLITPSPDSGTFKGVPFPRTGMEFPRNWDQESEIFPPDVDECFSAVSPIDVRSFYSGLGLSDFYQELTQNNLPPSNKRPEFTSSPQITTLADIRWPERTKSSSVSRDICWKRDHNSSVYHEHQDQSVSQTYIPPQNNYDDTLYSRSPPASNFHQRCFNPIVRRSRDSTPSRQSTQSPHITNTSRQSTPYTEYTQEIVQPVPGKSIIISQSPELGVIATIDRPRSPKSRNASHSRQSSGYRARSPVYLFPVDSVASAVAAIDFPSRPISRATSRNGHQRGRSSTRHIVAQETLPKCEVELTQCQVMAMSIVPSEPILTLNPFAEPEAYQTWTTRNQFGTRCENIMPRPGSAMW